MTTITGVLLDLDGVLYVGDTPLPGAIAAVAHLRDAGLRLAFLTNTTRTPHRLLLKKLAAMGLPLAPEELITPAAAARAWIAARGLRPHLVVHPALEEDFAGLPAGSEGEAVVIGDAGDRFTYAALNRAFRVLEDGAPLLALANNRAFRDRDGGLSLDAGPFVQALAYATRREPVVLGKPAVDFFAAALATIGCAAHEAVMIGDDVESDVGGAMAAGLGGVLVRTGKYQPGAEARIDPPPSAICDDLPAVVERLLACGLN